MCLESKFEEYIGGKLTPADQAQSFSNLKLKVKTNNNPEREMLR